jgi:hypothetical protein
MKVSTHETESQGERAKMHVHTEPVHSMNRNHALLVMLEKHTS